MSIHVFYGRSRRESDPEDKCLYCDCHDDMMAYTYFGAAVCGVCWDSRWRAEEDGACDPPFHEIKSKVSGEWFS